MYNLTRAIVGGLSVVGLLAPFSAPAAADEEVARPTCTIRGTNGDDRLVGTSDRDVICGLAGSDTINAGGGNDVVFAGQSGELTDRIFGDAGHDIIFGGRGQADYYGNGGNDILVGSPAFDNLVGGKGNDVLFAGVGGVDVGLKGGPGGDVAIMLDTSMDTWVAETEPGVPIPILKNVRSIPAALGIAVSPSGISETATASFIKGHFSFDHRANVCICNPNDLTL